MKIYYNQKLKKLSRNLRNNSTLSEILLWKEIKAKKLGCQFLRQRPIGDYIVDFYCEELRCAIEIDGVSHDSKIEDDRIREERLKATGVCILHFKDLDVKKNLEAVIRDIQEYIQFIRSKNPHFSKGVFQNSSFPKGGGGTPPEDFGLKNPSAFGHSL